MESDRRARVELRQRASRDLFGQPQRQADNGARLEPDTAEYYWVRKSAARSAPIPELVPRQYARQRRRFELSRPDGPIHRTLAEGRVELHEQLQMVEGNFKHRGARL